MSKLRLIFCLLFCVAKAFGLQKVSYAYNIKGNLRGINLTTNGRLDSSKVFALKLDNIEAIIQKN